MVLAAAKGIEEQIVTPIVFGRFCPERSHVRRHGLHLEAALCYPANVEPGDLWKWLVRVMRLPLVRCLVVLSLGLANGNGHAALHLGAAHSEPCPEEHAHHGGHTVPHHQHQPKKGFACCCDCLGCSSAAYISPGLSAAPAEFGSLIHYDAVTKVLFGRALLPEPDPPRPCTLS